MSLVASRGRYVTENRPVSTWDEFVGGTKMVLVGLFADYCEWPKHEESNALSNSMRI